MTRPVLLDRAEVLAMLAEARRQKDTVPDIERAWRTAIRAALR